MRKKCFAIILVSALLLPLLSVTAYAADEIDNAGMLDGIGGFFRDTGKFIADGFNKSIDNIKQGISNIGDGIGFIVSAIRSSVKDIVDKISSAIGKVVTAISRAINSLLKGIRDLFVPSDDYFSKVQARLQTSLNKKLGGILSVTEYLKERFARLSSPADINRLFILEFPQGHIFGGTKIDLLMRVRNNLPLFRGLLTSVFIVLPTIIFAYRRVKSMIKT